jgi:hypothetical protein
VPFGKGHLIQNPQLGRRHPGQLRETDIAWVAAERTIAAVELGDGGTALRRAAAIDPSGLSTERRVRFLVDMARAHHQ